MKNSILILLGFFLLFPLYGQTQSSRLTSGQWLEDFDFLVKKIEKTIAVFPDQGGPDYQRRVKKLRAEIPQMEEVAILRALGEFVASFKDGHTELNLAQSAAGFKRLPLLFYYFGTDLHIILTDKDHQELLGKKVTHIDSKPVVEIYRGVLPLLAHDNEMEFKYAAPDLFALPALLHQKRPAQNPDQLVLGLEEGQNVTVKALNREKIQSIKWVGVYDQLKVEPPLYLSKPGPRYWHTYLADRQTFYFQFNRINNQKGGPSIKKFVKEMFMEIDRLRPQKLVIDLRRNNGGNYNLSAPLIKAIAARPWLNQKGKLFVLNGRRTFSAATVTTIFCKRDLNGLVVGEPSRSKPNGSENNEYAELPNSKLLLSYTTRGKNHWPELGDARFVAVDIAVENTIEDYMAGRDRVLERAIEY